METGNLHSIGNIVTMMFMRNNSGYQYKNSILQENNTPETMVIWEEKIYVVLKILYSH
jgi:hypothetical protein